MTEKIDRTAGRMPVLFAGHGSPMNAIEDNVYSRTWRELGSILPKPRAVLSISAHWVAEGLGVNTQSRPETVYDMYGFPEELYRVAYKPPGAPWLGGLLAELTGLPVNQDNTWGIDHGTWSVLRRIYPDADVPVTQLSIDGNASLAEHFRTGQALRPLRDEGILIFGSGNVVHNLALVSPRQEGGFPWAYEFDGYVKNNLLTGHPEALAAPEEAGPSASRAFYTTEHYVPLLVAAGAADEKDSIRVFNEACLMGSLSMTGYLFGLERV